MALAGIALFALVFPACNHATGPANADAKPSTSWRLIIRIDGHHWAGSAIDLGPHLTRHTGVPLRYIRPLATGAHLYVAEAGKPRVTAAQILEILNSRPEISHAEIDQRLHPATPQN